MSEYIGNRYKVLKLLGKGGMAYVYLAFDTILKREVAVKVMKSDMSDDELALERFKREAGAVTQLSHPNIVDVYDVGDEDDKHYIVMEYVRGYTLKQLIKKRGPIPYKEAVWMIKQLAGALMEAHRNNVIHRDVKSQNVLIKDDGTVKLSDFGIALANNAMQITKKDSVLGSVHYLAPELSQGKQANMQSDIYSLGIVFYELLTGDVPFKADTPINVALRHIKEDVPSVRKFNPEIPQSVENVLIKATAKSLNNRYKNIALMLQDLNECLKKDHLNDPKLVFNNEVNRSNSDSVFVSDLADRNQKEKRSPISIIFLTLVSLLSIGAVVIVLFLSGLIGNSTKYVKVPDLKNLTVQEAKDLLADKKLEIDDSRITWTLSDDVQKDLIISSIPDAEEEVEVGSKIKITVSSGIYSVLKDYVGTNYKDALEELNKLNFKVKTLPVDSDLEAGIIIEQSLEAGSKFDASLSNEISLTYSRGKTIMIDHAIIGMHIDDAVNYLYGNGIKYELVKQNRADFSDEELQDSATDHVIKTNPEPGSYYTKNSDVVVYVYYYGED